MGSYSSETSCSGYSGGGRPISGGSGGGSGSERQTSTSVASGSGME